MDAAAESRRETHSGKEGEFRGLQGHVPLPRPLILPSCRRRARLQIGRPFSEIDCGRQAMLSIIHGNRSRGGK